MKKRRDLAKKILKFSLMVSLAVSAFFYIPMEVQAASSSVTSSYTPNTALRYNTVHIHSDVLLTNSDSFSGNYVLMSGSLEVDVTASRAFYWRLVCAEININDTMYPVSVYASPGTTDSISSYTLSKDFTIAVPVSEQYVVKSVLRANMFGSGSGNFTVNVDFTLDDVSFSTVGSGDYLSGYDAGYAAGLTQGESSGYSSGYSDGYTEGESSGYESGYQAGVDSVDTQSYYDAGYDAGYTSGYNAGYDTGYDDGYDDAMSRVESWGADSAEYPVLLYSDAAIPYYTEPIDIRSSTDIEIDNFETCASLRWRVVEDIDPNHTYCLSVVTCIPEVMDVRIFYSYYDVFISVGGREYPLEQHGMIYQMKAFVPGDILTDDVSLGVRLYGAYCNDSSTIEGSFRLYYSDTAFEIYDYGPAGDTQNHIANQTDQLTNGFDSSSGDAVASEFSDGVAEYEQVEGSLFTSAKSSLQDYQFFDLQSIPAVITGLSFVTSIMTSIFNSMGGVSGAGIVLSVLFSVMLVSVVSGLYRYYVSSGKSGKHDKKGGGG